jgi:hypothetical protein
LDYESSATSELDLLAEAWARQSRRLEESSPDGLNEFIGQLVRSWAIETGILERLYDLDEGVTQTLVELGFREDVLARNGTDAPENLLSMLKDHVAAADMVQAVVRDERPFSKHFLRELHQLITRTQSTMDAVTSEGTQISVSMAHGEFKKWPNNPSRSNGTIAEYAPPEQVEPEIDTLVTGFALMSEQSTAVQAAWLHHRFTQIHPFQDGNGRVARALTNLVFIRAGLFPLVIDRTQRSSYIAALEQADDGDLGPLIDFFATIQAATILKALSLAADEERGAKASTVTAVVSRLAEKFAGRVKDRASALRGVNEIAQTLRDAAAAYLMREARAATDRLRDAGVFLKVYSQSGGSDSENAHFWKFQLIEIAHEMNYWINYDEDSYWTRIAVEGAPVRLQYVVSIHHVGHELSGVMQATAFVEFESPRVDLSATETGHADPERTIRNATPTLFSVTWQADETRSKERFERWLQESFAVALRYWLDLV